MKARFLAIVVAAGLAGCNTGYVPPQTPSYGPGPAHDTEFRDGRPGLFGDLTWTIDMNTGQKVSPAAAPAATSAPATASTPAVAGAAAAGTAAAASPSAASAAEQEEFKKWRESAGSTERQEFEDWRAWQEWKRKNPK
jgi:hypothetical protein